MVGETPSTQDIKETITDDNARVNLLTLLGVFLVVAFSFKSVLIPIVVMIPIEVAIFINMAVPYVQGVDMIYMGYIIVSSILLDPAYQQLYREACNTSEEGGLH